MPKSYRPITSIFALAISWLVTAEVAADNLVVPVRQSGVGGGLAVCLGCDNGKHLVELATNESFLVHGLDADASSVVAARRRVQNLGRYGRVSVAQFNGRHLPYADNLVNLLVVNRLGNVPMEEVIRVLTPRGVALLPRKSAATSSGTEREVSGDWILFRKPVPAEIDDWTHYLHSANGNPVAADDAVKPPRQLQWVSAPKWARHHEHMASMNALVSSDGKVFSICDHGPRLSMLLPPEWKLSAHDAFNGLLLWERPIAEWYGHLQPLKSGPASLPRRLVADGGRVYVTLGIEAPVSVLDADTGETLFVCKGTESTQEIVLCGKKLFLVRGLSAGTAITAVDAASGKLLWERPGPVSALTLAADENKVVFFDGEKVLALRGSDGAELWTSEKLGEQGRANWMAKSAPRLILHDKAVVVAPKNKMYSLSAEDGKILWSAVHPHSGYASPKDLFVIDDLVWYGDTAGGRSSGEMTGRDIVTGEIKRSFPPDIDMVWLSHHRCHFSKATKNFILPARMGVEFVDLKREAWKQQHWIRGGCIYGVMPCNGLLYTPPHACACYFEAKQSGFSAYTSNTGPRRKPGSVARLEKGPAYGSIAKNADPQDSSEWPVFRHDSVRSGYAETAIPAKLAERWSADIGGKLTQPVTAGGTVYVSSVDKHTLYALDTETGKQLWQYTAGGRIDSPPAIYRGLAIFGSRDGWIYCLRISDGQLAWRFRASPDELLVMSYGQIESAWPVHGSVLIESDEIHCVAGRNMFLDGGLRYLRLDPATGKIISDTVMDETDPLLGGSIQKYDSWLDMTTTLPDILSCDGENVYMRSLPFDLKGNRRRITHIAEETETPHLFSPNGFLEDEWFHRSYWTFARSFPGGWIGHLNAGRYNPSGRLLVLDDSIIYGFGRKPSYYKWTTSLEYRLFAVDRKTLNPRDIYAFDVFKVAQQQKFPKMKIDGQLGLPSGPRPELKDTYDRKWEDAAPRVFARAMVGAGNRLFIAGPKDIMDEKEYYFRDAAENYEPIKRKLQSQAELWKGKAGAVLLAIDKEDGKSAAEYQLPAIPVFDGMIAANEKLFVSLADGKLICLGK